MVIVVVVVVVVVVFDEQRVIEFVLLCQQHCVPRANPIEKTLVKTKLNKFLGSTVLQSRTQLIAQIETKQL